MKLEYFNYNSTSDPTAADAIDISLMTPEEAEARMLEIDQQLKEADGSRQRQPNNVVSHRRVVIIREVQVLAEKFISSSFDHHRKLHRKS